MMAKKLNWRQARWSLLLARFDFLLHHRPGKTMGKSDALSQRVDHGTGMEDNQNLTLLTPNLFAIQALSRPLRREASRNIKLSMELYGMKIHKSQLNR